MGWDNEDWEPGIRVKLAWHEIEMAAQVGIRRRVESLRQGCQNAHGCDDKDSWGRDIEGAAAEMAFAKVLGKYWDGSVNTFKAPDVAGGWQVRHSQSTGACLIVRNSDSTQDRFVLVVGRIPSFWVVGWITGERAKRDWLLYAPGGRPAAYFVPQFLLKPFPVDES